MYLAGSLAPRVRHDDRNVVAGVADETVDQEPFSIAFATSPSTVSIMRADGFVCPPTEPMSALMTERVSLMSISPDRATPRPRRSLRRGDGAAHWRKERMVLR